MLHVVHGDWTITDPHTSAGKATGHPKPSDSSNGSGASPSLLQNYLKVRIKWI